MSPETRRYYEHRVEEQLELAQRANRGEVVQAHYRLADLYLDLLFPPDSGAKAGLQVGRPH